MNKIIAGLLGLCFVGSPALASTVIYDSTGGVSNGGDPLAPTGAGPILANEFVNPFASTISSVTLNLLNNGGPASIGNFSIDIRGIDVSGAPGAVIGRVSTVNDTTIGSTFSLYSYAAFEPINLAAGASYYLSVEDGNPSSAITLGNTVDPTILGRASVSAGAYYYNNGGVQPNSGGPYEMAISVNSVPEPASVLLLMAALGSMATITGVRRRV